MSTRRFRTCAALVLALAAFNLGFGLAGDRVHDFDEAHNGTSADEMLRSRRFLVTTYEGQPEMWSVKPPLGIWIIAASFALLGTSVLALKLPSALCALATVALVLAIGVRWFGRREALLAGLILATCFPFLLQHGGRSGDYDAPLTLAMTVALACLPGLAERRRAAAGFGLAVGVGFLIKSFAVLPLLGAATLALTLGGDAKRIGIARLAISSLAATAVVLPWAVARYLVDGTSYFRAMLETDLLHRSMQPIEGSAHGPLYHAGFLLDRAAPWSELVVVCGVWLGVKALRQGTRPPHSVVRLAAWILVPLVLYSAAATKHHWYLNPTLPALALLASWITLALARRSSPATARVLLAFAAVAILYGEARVMHHVLGAGLMGEDQRFLVGLGDLGPRAVVRGERPWSQSERFLLETVARLKLDGASAARRRIWLLHDRDAGPPPRRVVRESPRYQLVAPNGARLRGRGR